MKSAPSNFFKIALTAILILLVSSRADAQSILVPAPADSSIYDKTWASLNVAQRRKFSLYGLRFAPLDPRVWGLRIVDVTESKILIPIRPFFLRASEQTNFRVVSIDVAFKFKKVSAAIMEKHPREHDPVLEIGFAAAYTQPAPGMLPDKDRGFAARLSAFPAIASGFVERKRDRYQDLKGCSTRTLETGKEYTARLLFTEKQVELLLDGVSCATLDGDFRSGLISMETSWSPVFFKTVEIRATQGNLKALSTYSGVIDTSAPKKPKL